MEFFKAELEHLNSDVAIWETFDSCLTITKLKVVCLENSKIVAERAHSVLKKVIKIRAYDEWPDYEDWKKSLPIWFVESCANEMSPEEAKRWLKEWQALSLEEQQQQAKEQKWSLLDWLYWFEPGPDERQWRWVASDIVSNDYFIVGIAVADWPVAYGALEWLYRAAGATSVTEYD